jgi:hypothetical protein
MDRRVHEAKRNPSGALAVRQGGTLEEGDLPMKKVYVRVAVLASAMTSLLLAGSAAKWR